MMTIRPSAACAFNRYSLTYSAPCPLKATLTYTIDGKTNTEVFYLEAGDGKFFTSYIDAYLDERTADAGEVTVTCDRIVGDETQIEGEFTFTADFTFDVAPVYAKETYFFENERYRVGVELAWGGGLSYLLDKTCTVPGLGNLLNHFDTGRLVQQSYYGTGDPPYVRGEFMGNSWVYNPVQGGDRGNNKSKLIETRVSEHEVYVKCRPRDWGHDGGDTYSYMENWYRLDGDYLVVDNRFTDFSGWKHPCNGQELPAFYTVSYLGDFHWYNGDRPWTDDEMSMVDDLPFWPDDWNKCTFLFQPGNTETWAAFTDKDGYGLGLYVPNVTRWVAGRHAYDGSKDPRAGSTNYIAPTRRITLTCFKPLTYSYLICAGQLSDIRAKFKARKDAITNQSLTDY